MIEKYLIENAWKRINKCCGFPTYYNETHVGYKVVVYRSRNRCAILKNNLRCVPHDVSGDEIEMTMKSIFEK